MSMLSLMAKAKPDEKRAVTVSTRVTQGESDHIDALADADDRTAAYIIAKAIREYLARHPLPRPRK